MRKAGLAGILLATLFACEPVPQSPEQQAYDRARREALLVRMAAGGAASVAEDPSNSLRVRQSAGNTAAVLGAFGNDNVAMSSANLSNPGASQQTVIIQQGNQQPAAQQLPLIFTCTGFVNDSTFTGIGINTFRRGEVGYIIVSKDLLRTYGEIFYRNRCFTNNSEPSAKVRLYSLPNASSYIPLNANELSDFCPNSTWQVELFDKDDRSIGVVRYSVTE